MHTFEHILFVRLVTKNFCTLRSHVDKVLIYTLFFLLIFNVLTVTGNL